MSESDRTWTDALARIDTQLIAKEEEEPSVMGGGCGLAPIPTKAEAEVIWRAAYVARMVERGIHVEDARACGEASSVVLSDDPEQAADDELTYWDSDGDL